MNRNRMTWITAVAIVLLPLMTAGALWADEVRADGASRLTTPPGTASDQNPAFSPDDETMVFTRFDQGYNDGPAGLFLLDPSTGAVARLTEVEDQDNVNLPGSCWNGVTNRIVFASDRDEADDLWRIAPDGTDFSRITNHSGTPWYVEPSWSPDGQRIVFQADTPASSEDGYTGKIFVVDADGSNLVALTSDDAFDDRQPNWSPAGDRILFQRHVPDSEDWDLWTVHPDGTGLEVVNDTDSSDTDASWSPDGRFIVYSSDWGGLQTPNLFVVPVDGGAPVRVTTDTGHEDGAPSWSPDGHWIAFESHPGADEETPSQLWRIAAPPSGTTAPWPYWAHSARLAGAAFELEMTTAEIDAKLDQLASDGVSVVIVDGPTGWSYTAWTRDDEFDVVLAMMRDEIFPRAHQRGLRVVWYLTALELICSDCAGTSIDPTVEHPEWLQIDQFGQPIAFAGVEGVFWLEENDFDVWLSPESPYRGFYIDRIRQIATAGADGLWMDVAYLLNGLGQFEDLWPSTDDYSRVAFETATGHSEIPVKNWENLGWRHWVRWRMKSIADFVRAVADAAHGVDSDLLFFTENWCMDSNFVTQYAQDPLDFLPGGGVATAHELEPLDQDNRGMLDASLEDWQDYALLVKFGIASNRDRPAWILTYASAVDDSLREAAVHLAEGACFYEAKGPEMLDDTTGSRLQAFSWIEANAAAAYRSGPLADVALYLSPRSRDFIDREESGDDKFDEGDTIYLKEYRKQGRVLLARQIPFDIVTASWTAEDLGRYRFLVVPAAACLSDMEVSTLRAYAAAGGEIATSGEVGTRDQWCVERDSNAFEGVATLDPDQVSSEILETSLSSEDRPRVLAEVRSGEDEQGAFLFVGLAKLMGLDVQDIGISVMQPDGFIPVEARWSSPGNMTGTVPVSANGGRLHFTIPTLESGVAVVIRGGSVALRARRPTGGRSGAGRP
ncbi:MAG: hypothetical protein DRJ61_01420 [Acidobacteria bacterium]|nr:MAG: hypothetical protein DRJ61_01420 [Acidobacteriota bacterium]